MPSRVFTEVYESRLGGGDSYSPSKSEDNDDGGGGGSGSSPRGSNSLHSSTTTSTTTGTGSSSNLPPHHPPPDGTTPGGNNRPLHQQSHWRRQQRDRILTTKDSNSISNNTSNGNGRKLTRSSTTTTTKRSTTTSGQQNGGGGGGDPSGSQPGSLSTSSTEERHKELDVPIQSLYEIRTRLGKGAYGIVWEAVTKSTGNRVALKKIFDAFRNNTDAQRTYREISFLRSFGHHPKIIQLLSVHRAENDLDIYLVFPLMSHDLHKIIKWKPDKLSDPIIRQITYEMLVGIQYLHSADVIHRDLKPANILLDVDFHVKLADFGLSRSLAEGGGGGGDWEGGGDACGVMMTEYVATRWYRPLEILLSCRIYTKGVDMWAVACILGEMYLSKPLFPGNSTLDQIELIVQTIVPPGEEEIERMMRGSGKATLNAALRAALGQKRGPPIVDIFGRWSVELVDFVERLLVFCPEERLTAEDALCHPYLEGGWRDREGEIVCGEKVRPPLSDQVQLGLEEYRRVIYEMIREGGSSGGGGVEEQGDDLYDIPEVGLEEQEGNVKDLYSSSGSSQGGGGGGGILEEEENVVEEIRYRGRPKSVLTLPSMMAANRKGVNSGALVISKDYLEDERDLRQDFKFEYVIPTRPARYPTKLFNKEEEENGGDGNLEGYYNLGGGSETFGVKRDSSSMMTSSKYGTNGKEDWRDPEEPKPRLHSTAEERRSYLANLEAELKGEVQRQQQKKKGFSAASSGSSSGGDGGKLGGKSAAGGGDDDKDDFVFKYPFPPTTPRKNYKSDATTSMNTSTMTTGGKRNPFSDYQQMLTSKATSNQNYLRSGVVGGGRPSVSSTSSSNRKLDLDKLLTPLPSQQVGGGGGDLGGKLQMEMGQQRRVNSKGRLNHLSVTAAMASSSSSSLEYPPPNPPLRLSSSSGGTVIDDLVSVNGKNPMAYHHGGGGVRDQNLELKQRQTQKNGKPMDYYRFGGLKEPEPEQTRRPFNGRSVYGKLHHKLPSVNKHSTSLPPPPSRSRVPPQQQSTSTSTWHSNAVASASLSDRGGRSSVRNGAYLKPQHSQSAYFPSTTLYSKNTPMYGTSNSSGGDHSKNLRKAASEPSASYYNNNNKNRTTPGGGGGGGKRTSTRYSSGSQLPPPRRQNWTEPIYPEMGAMIHASDLFDLQHNIQRPSQYLN